MTHSKHHIAIYGAGLAGQMTALALIHNLPSSYKICLIEDKSSNNDADVLYGNVCSPNAYDFHRTLGLSEPDLLFNSDTNFSYGSHYRHWGHCQRDWVQCYHLPLPVQESVEFHHSLLRAGIQNLEPYLVSAQAARHGVFAHPPQDPNIPLSRAEYGYQVSTDKYLAAIFNILKNAPPQKIQQIETESLKVSTSNNCIDCLILSDGKKVEADWFIDCSGPKASLLESLDAKLISERKVNFLSSSITKTNDSETVRQVAARDFGWHSKTPLRDTIAKLTLYADDDEAARKFHGVSELSGEVELGYRQKAWVNNCIAIGHAAALIEPLTPAPMTLLQRDIERLLELIPINQDDRVERKEFNRRFVLDYEHSCIFNDAFYQCDDFPNTSFWQQAQSLSVNEKLQIKLTQFESRAIITMFDLEPFNEQDWLILHFGMQRKPRRYNRFADRHSSERLLKWFENIESDINAIVNKMPPSQRYVLKMLDYLRSQT